VFPVINLTVNEEISIMSLNHYSDLHDCVSDRSGMAVMKQRLRL